MKIIVILMILLISGCLQNPGPCPSIESLSDVQTSLTNITGTYLCDWPDKICCYKIPELKNESI